MPIKLHGMLNDNNLYLPQFEQILRGGVAQISTILPADWTEKRLTMDKPRPGPFRYSETPYTREIINRFSPYDDARVVAVMKGAQIGFSSGVLIPGIGWMIENNPGNCYLMVGAPDLIPKASENIDLMIDRAQLASYIRSQSARRSSRKTGDTDTKKDFPMGYLSIGSANNHKAIAQVHLQFILLDDLDAMKGESKSSGNLIKLIEKRAAAYKDSYKMFMISTPLEKHKSLILPAYLEGDRRHFYIQCQCCHEPIVLKWDIKEGEVINHLTGETANNRGGITWDVDDITGELVEKSVGYCCYKCGGWFNDKNKYNFLNSGIWHATFKPQRPQYYSYYIPSLYAPIWMFDWKHCVRDWLKCHPVGEPRNEKEYQVFINTVIGEPYEGEAIETSSKNIQRNRQNYPAGIIPESISMDVGNGDIVMLTCAADLNGMIDDARLDYEVVAWDRLGASWSIIHGSIGTFQRGDSKNNDRKKSTYEYGKENSVWKEYEKVLDTIWQVDTGRKMKIRVSALDTSSFTTYAYEFMDRTNHYVLGIKGDTDGKFKRKSADVALFKRGASRTNMWILEVNAIKDINSEYMSLKWDKSEDSQPIGFMNFPDTSDTTLYQKSNFFEHFEAEECIISTNSVGEAISKWEKKSSKVANHMLDCRIYNIAVKDISVYLFGVKLKKPKDFNWVDYCALL
jgi:phage terminase large subunit GpA-like protein